MLRKIISTLGLAMKWSKLGLMTVTCMLAGCVAKQYVPTQTELQRSKDIELVDAAQARFASCQENIINPKLNPKIAAADKLVSNEVMIASEESTNRFDLMASNAKITDKQKTALIEVINANLGCYREIETALQNFPTLSIHYANLRTERDVIYANLINRKISIGEANTQLLTLVAKTKKAYVESINILNSNYQKNINQELIARDNRAAQDRAIATQLFINQQNINAQQNIVNQQLMQNQLNQLNNRRSINTNCSQIGNSVNCTSY